jgi:hypothetical protein
MKVGARSLAFVPVSVASNNTSPGLTEVSTGKTGAPGFAAFTILSFPVRVRSGSVSLDIFSPSQEHREGLLRTLNFLLDALISIMLRGWRREVN